MPYEGQVPTKEAAHQRRPGVRDGSTMTVGGSTALGRSSQRHVSVTSSVAMSFGTSMLIQGLNVITGILTSRLLGPEGKGILTAVLLWPALIAMIGSLGISDAVTYYVAKDPARAGAITQTALILGLAQSAVLSVVGYFIIQATLARYGPDIVRLDQWYLLYIVLSLPAGYAIAALGGRMQFGAVGVLRLSLIVGIVVGEVYLWTFDTFTVIHVILVFIIANGLTSIVAALLLHRSDLLWYTPEWHLARALLSYGVKSHTANAASTITDRLDQILISLFLPASQLGIYVVAGTFSAATALVGGAFSTVCLPAVSRVTDAAAMREALGRLVRTTLALSIIVSAVLLAVSPWLLQLFFGAAFSPALPTMRILLVSIAVLNINRVLAQGVRAFGRPLAAGIAGVVAAASTAAALTLLLPHVGITGAAIANLLAYSTSTVSLLWFSSRHLGCSLRQMLVVTAEDVELARKGTSGAARWVTRLFAVWLLAAWRVARWCVGRSPGR